MLGEFRPTDLLVVADRLQGHTAMRISVSNWATLTRTVSAASAAMIRIAKAPENPYMVFPTERNLQSPMPHLIRRPFWGTVTNVTIPCSVRLTR